jgi:hypothetical protein
MVVVGRRRAFLQEREAPAARRLQRLEAARDEVGPVHGEVLRLQRSGGNEAVAGVLARDAVAQDTKTPAPKKSGPEEKKPDSAKTMKVDGVGEIPLLSFSGPSRDRNEIQVSVSGDSPFVVELQKRAASGGGLGKVVIDFGYAKWVLGDVYIGASQIGSGDPPVASFTLNYASLSLDDGTSEQPGKVD